MAKAAVLPLPGLGSGNHIVASKYRCQTLLLNRRHVVITKAAEVVQQGRAGRFRLANEAAVVEAGVVKSSPWRKPRLREKVEKCARRSYQQIIASASIDRICAWER